MRYLVRVLGVAAVVIALYIIVGEQLVGTSSAAFVDAKLKSVRAPITGWVELSSSMPLGTRIQVDQPLGTILASRQNTPEQAGTRTALELERAELSALTQRARDTDFIDVLDLPYELLRRQARIDALTKELGAFATLEAAQALRAPSGGVIWATPIATGEIAAAGAPIIHIADCDTAFVYASVDRPLYDGLSLGDIAQFKLRHGPPLQATVSFLGGLGPREVIETLAIAPSEDAQKGYAVFLAVPGLSARETCQLGQTSRVVFSEGPLSFLFTWWRALGV